MDSRKLKGLGLPYGPKDAERRYWERLGVSSGYLPSGIAVLDGLLPGGGFPRSKVTEIYGESMSGKSALCKHLVAETQRKGGICVWIDSEYSLTRADILDYGIDPDRLNIIRPGEEQKVHRLILEVIKLNCADLIIVDSLTALDTGLSEAMHYSFQKEWMIYLREALDRSSAAFVFVSQTRDRVFKNGISERISCAWDLSELCHLRIQLSGALIDRAQRLTRAKLSGMASGEVEIEF